MNEGALEAAIRCASEALGYDPGNAAAQSLKDQAIAAIAERRIQVERDRAARDAAEAARTLAASGDPVKALRQLRSFTPAHEAVTRAIADIQLQQQRSNATVIKPVQEPAPVAQTLSETQPLDRRASMPRQEASDAAARSQKPATSNTVKLIAASAAAIAVLAIGFWSMQAEPLRPASSQPLRPRRRRSTTPVVNRAGMNIEGDIAPPFHAGHDSRAVCKSESARRSDDSP